MSHTLLLTKYLTALLPLISWVTISHSQTVVNFTYTGSAQTWVVPPCVNNITITVRGAQGGGVNGGLGSQVSGVYAVVPGSTLQINVGGQGGCPAAGWNGGGLGQTASGPGNESCGGGGASDIRLTPFGLANRVIVASGGGGMGGGDTEAQGGAGGCATGLNGTSPFGVGGYGGSSVAGGAGGPPWIASGNYGTNGASGVGGTGGSDPCYNVGPGGGGGGGYYGGGGGGSDCYPSSPLGGGGGGGGSCLVPGGLSCTGGINAGNGLVTITYTPAGIAATASNTGPYCVGDPIQLNSPGGAISYSWSGPASFTSSIQNPAILSSGTANSGVYTVTITDGGGCTSTATTTVTVNTLPTINPTSNNPLCEGQTLNLGASGGASYSWIGPNGFISSSANPSIPGITTLGSGTYIVTVTGASGCQNTDSVNVVVFNAYSITASSNAPLCDGASLSLSGGSGASTYSWVGPGGFSSSSQNPVISPISAAGSGTYTLVATDVNGCQATDSVVVVVNALPNAVAGNSGPVCENTAINLSSGGGATYGWTGPGGYNSGNQNPVITSATSSISGTYTVVVTDLNGCTQSATTTVVVNALPFVGIGSNGPVCNGSSLSINATGGGLYQWTGPNGFNSNSGNNTINPATTINSGTYVVVVDDGNGCTTSASISVVVNELPVAGFSYITQCFNHVSFNATGTGGLSPYNFSWDMNLDGIPDETGSNLDYTFPDSNDIYITLWITDANGCSSSNTTLVDVKGGIQNPLMPNILYRNSVVNNNKYDFEIFAPGFNECVDYTFSIFDRWGVKVYETTNSSLNPDLACSDCFRGLTDFGAPLSPGVYYFVLTGSEDIVMNGAITIME